MKSIDIFTFNMTYDVKKQKKKQRGKKQMVYQTSQTSKQGDIRNKVTTKSRPVKQVLTLAKAHSGRHKLHRHLSAMGHITETKALSGWSLCHRDSSSTCYTICILPSSCSLPLLSSDLSVGNKSGHGFCKARAVRE